MQYSYIVVGNQIVKGMSVIKIREFFPQFFCAGFFKDHLDSLAEIVKINPQLIFFNVNNSFVEGQLSVESLTDSFRFTKLIPYIIVLNPTNDFILTSIQNGCSDYLHDSNIPTISKSLAKFEKKAPVFQQKIICIRSYSDYHFLKYEELVYLKADNNTTDFKLINGSVVTAYKTLKYFETVLPPYFIRIHKSYIVNIYFISRIHFSKSRCYLNFNEELPFSNTYRSSVEHILQLNLIGC